jgi:cytoskeletal protein CcmA (bactofilin family)
MKKTILFSLVGVFFFVLQASAAIIAPDANDIDANTNANINESAVTNSTTTPIATMPAQYSKVYEKTYYWSGENLDIEGHFLNDVIVAGNNITIDGLVEGDIIAVGNYITINGQVKGNVRIAGNYLIVDAQVQKNVTAFGNSIIVGKDSIIEKDATIFGNQITIDGQIKGETIKQDSTTQPKKEEKKENAFTKYTELSYWIFLLIRLSWLLICGIVLMAVVKKWIIKTIDKMYCCPGKNLLWGLLAFFLIPVAIIAVCLTIIGMPLGLIALILYIIILYLSAIFIGYAIGKKILPNVKSPIWPMILGTTIFILIDSLPVIGSITFIANCWVLGALINKNCQGNCKKIK